MSVHGEEYGLGDDDRSVSNEPAELVGLVTKGLRAALASDITIPSVKWGERQRAEARSMNRIAFLRTAAEHEQTGIPAYRLAVKALAGLTEADMRFYSQAELATLPLRPRDNVLVDLFDTAQSTRYRFAAIVVARGVRVIANTAPFTPNAKRRQSPTISNALATDEDPHGLRNLGGGKDMLLKMSEVFADAMPDAQASTAFAEIVGADPKQELQLLTNPALVAATGPYFTRLAQQTLSSGALHVWLTSGQTPE